MLTTNIIKVSNGQLLCFSEVKDSRVIVPKVFQPSRQIQVAAKRARVVLTRFSTTELQASVAVVLQALVCAVARYHVQFRAVHTSGT